MERESESFSLSLPGIKAVFLDLDGTIYLGNNLIEGALDFLDRLKESGIHRFFLSNNSSRSKDDYVNKLAGFGIAATTKDILLSTDGVISWLKQENYDRTYLVGTESMCEMFEAEGISTRDKEPQVVVLGYDTEVNYEKLTQATIFLHQGIPLVASHPDMVCPSPDGGLPDVGAYLALFKATTGVEASQVFGKPSKEMVSHKLAELRIQPHEAMMVGDRLYTDIELAMRTGMRGCLVLSGEAGMEDLVEATQEPDLVVASVAELIP